MAEKPNRSERRERKSSGTGLENHIVHSIRPTGSPYRFGKFHKNRVSLNGYKRELTTLIKRFFVNGHPQKFLIFGRPRSGSTLLNELLN